LALALLLPVALADAHPWLLVPLGIAYIVVGAFSKHPALTATASFVGAVIVVAVWSRLEGCEHQFFGCGIADLIAFSIGLVAAILSGVTAGIARHRARSS
jgi:hypothetical protein